MSESDAKPIFYFSLITIVLWVLIYTVLGAFDSNIDELQNNNNVLLSTIINYLESFYIDNTGGTLDCDFIAEFLGFCDPEESTSISILEIIFSPIVSFLEIWNVIPTEIFYILFIPWLLAFIYSILALLGGYIPFT